jgi:hypothetical protein
MSEQERPELQQIKLSFPYKKGNLPSYSNAALVNNLGEGTFVIDFGFFDPLSTRDSPNLDTTFEVEPVTRILLTRKTAMQLLNSLSSSLSTQIPDDNED